MILLLNVFITDQGFTVYDRGLLPASNRLDVFKYTLASYAVIDWSHVFIFCELDAPYAHRREELDAFIAEHFPRAVSHPWRNDRQKHWQKSLEPVLAAGGDEFILFMCNDDHPFLDCDLAMLGRVEAALNGLQASTEFLACYPTHWPEMMAMRQDIIGEAREYFLRRWKNFDSVQIVNKRLLEHWWFAHDYGDAWMPRTDPKGDSRNAVSPETTYLIPYRELFRHFDGYSHAGISLHDCPPLFIPPGFFEGDIRIDYCAPEKRPDRVLVNPLSRQNSAESREGADLRCLLEDLPLFWRDRISDIRDGGLGGPEERRMARNRAELEKAWAWSVHRKIGPAMLLPTGEVDQALLLESVAGLDRLLPCLRLKDGSLPHAERLQLLPLRYQAIAEILARAGGSPA